MHARMHAVARPVTGAAWCAFCGATVATADWLQVKVLWVINAVEKNFEKALPGDVRDALNAARKKKGGIYATEEGKKDADKEEEDAKGELLLAD
jgi:hypothetical protein